MNFCKPKGPNGMKKFHCHEKIHISQIHAKNIFPFNIELSAGIDIELLNISFLIQPKLFLRMRPGKQEVVKKKLLAAQISFEEINDNCLAFANGTKLEEVVDINREAVIQDVNSQMVGELLTVANAGSNMHVWDCCAASGGKSIIAYDLLPGCKLTVSDVRPSIIHNLKNRFKAAEITIYTSFVADVTRQKDMNVFLGKNRFDVIICDAPCSGSGTWGRTPEQLLFFKETEIERYASLQKSIAANTIPFIKKDGFFLYITCSVFKKENEEVVEFIQQKCQLTLIKAELLKGYEIKADTMFAALFQNQNS